MGAFRSWATPRRRLVLLVWLALLLPLAQGAAAWHALSHVQPDAANEFAGKQAPHFTHCDLCLAAAAIGNGAPAAAPPALPLAAVHHAAPATVVAALALAALALAYRSRAPPVIRR